MRITRLTIKNSRGVRDGELLLPQHAVLVGDNNIGKSTVLEVIDLVLGPERLSRRPIVDEHDFHAGRYIDAENRSVPIAIEVVVADLNEDQQRHVRDHIEWWDTSSNTFLSGPPPEGTDAPAAVAALRVGFEGAYDHEEDDFAGNTFFASPAAKEDGSRDTFRAADKRFCGFLF